MARKFSPFSMAASRCAIAKPASNIRRFLKLATCFMRLWVRSMWRIRSAKRGYWWSRARVASNAVQQSEGERDDKKMAAHSGADPVFRGRGRVARRMHDYPVDRVDARGRRTRAARGPPIGRAGRLPPRESGGLVAIDCR